MKRFFLPIMLFISILRVVANPLPVPSVEISELQFGADGSWILEIAVSPVGANSIEAIWIKSNSGKSMIQNFVDDGSYKLLVVENDNLATPLTINPLQDSISVTFVWLDYEGWYSEPLIYGYPNSNVRTPKIGQSIAAIFYSGGPYSITNSPTIGVENDSTGMMGTIKGIVYDKDGLPLSNMGERGLMFEYLGSIFYPQSDGSYSTRYYSRDNDEVWSLKYRYENVYRSVGITPITFSMQPDSVIIRDIYLTGEIATGINKINSNTESVLKIYPQPVKQQSLNYEISIPVKSAETYLIFRNMNGQAIYKFSVTENKGIITLPENIKNGSYIVQLISNRKNYATAKLIVQ
ncbi:MAG: T9SS type A sorting domain-containing protein [Paludibacter sp.]|nr:T9SS type A sorting domain-containing protein [Paludibacter sp.]